MYVRLILYSLNSRYDLEYWHPHFSLLSSGITAINHHVDQHYTVRKKKNQGPAHAMLALYPYVRPSQQRMFSLKIVKVAKIRSQ